MSQIQLPNKSLFKLDEVSSLVGVKPYVLRFWENQFAEISPIRSSSGQMLYREEDVQTIAKIKSLLFEKKLSVDQVKQVMAGTEVKTIIPEAKLSKPKIEKTIKAEKTPTFASGTSELLITAQEKLSKMLSLTEMLKKTHHWD